jgi:riboflavin synthase
VFTGIISELGTVVSAEPQGGVMRLTLEAPTTSGDLSLGDSVAVNGVCLTAIDVEESSFTVEVVHESVDRSSLGSIAAGDVVNLERPMHGQGRFDGHIVQGHVDGVGTISKHIPDGGSTRVRVGVPQALAPYIVEKGSIAVDGTSLTVSGVSDVGAREAWFEFVVIPHTLEVTVFGNRGVGDTVNIEVDVLAKYVERLLGFRA